MISPSYRYGMEDPRSIDYLFVVIAALIWATLITAYIHA